MTRQIKITTTLFILLLVFVPSLLFLISPIQSDLTIKFDKLRPYTISRKAVISIFSTVSPNKSKYSEQILGTSTIEESLGDANLTIDKSKIEDANTVLEIPSLDISGKIFQGEDSSTMDKGFWHFPLSRNPGEKGNVVIIGHRFMKIPPMKDTFFNLDKIDIGDRIHIVSDFGEYNYIVLEKKDVEPNDISVIQDTNDYTLTLVTCTPLWTSQQRLVVIAKLDKLYKKV